MTRLGLLLVLTAATGLSLAAQQPAPAFEVASIKENKETTGSLGLRRSPDGSLLTQRTPPRLLITVAYGLQPFQLVGAPAWIATTYYDINAKAAPSFKTSRDQMSDMLQVLLVDRFKLAFHREVRSTDGFALVPIRLGALGPDLKVSNLDCDKTPAARPCNQAIGTANTFKASGASMWSLVQQLVATVGAPVTDETGLFGTYDINLRWSPDTAPTDDLPSLFTALQEQLGLKLERRRVDAEFFVVDRIERPTPD